MYPIQVITNHKQFINTPLSVRKRNSTLYTLLLLFTSPQCADQNHKKQRQAAAKKAKV